MKKQLLTAFLFFTLLLTHTALAQTTATDVLNTVSSLLIQFSGIIFILVFVLLLLVIGGVWKPSFGGILSPGLIIFVILIVLVFLFPQFITFPDYLKTVPDSFKVYELPGGAKDALQLIGLPKEWGYVPAIIYLFILPFAAIYTLFWAFLQVLGIFPQKNVNRMLALIVAFMTIPMGWFVKMVWSLFSFMGAWSLAIFAAMFIAGVFFRGAGFVTSEAAAIGKRMNARARNHIQQALIHINNRQATDAERELTAAGSILGFHADYYGHISKAINAVRAPDWSEATKEVSEALRLI
jgi:MFS family permease